MLVTILDKFILLSIFHNSNLWNNLIHLFKKTYYLNILDLLLLIFYYLRITFLNTHSKIDNHCL